MNKLKKIPKFNSEDEEREFWANKDSTGYINWHKSEIIVLPKLEPTTKTISLRMSESMLNQVRLLANQRVVLYQSLIKMFLKDKINEELKSNSIMKRIIFIKILLLFCGAGFAQANEKICPTISLNNTIPINAVPVEFSVKASEEIKNYEIEYVWEIEDGKLISGQGTQSIRVIYFERYDAINTIAKLFIKGLPEECNANFSEVFHVNIFRSKPIKFWSTVLLDEYAKTSFGIEKAKFEQFYEKLQEDESSEGIIRLQIDNKTDLYNRLRTINLFISALKFNKNRITIAFVKENNEKTQLWIVPEKMKLPNCENCIFLKLRN